MRRFPWAPLERIVGLSLDSPRAQGNLPGWTDRDLAMILGCSPSSVVSHRKRATVREDIADRLATSAGLHPSNIWDDWWEAA